MNPAAVRAWLLAAAVCATVPARAEIIDGVVAIVGTEAITLSELMEEIQLQAMLSLAEPARFDEGGADVLRMLVDRRLVELDLALTPFLGAADSEVAASLRGLREQGFIGGRTFGEALSHYGLTERRVREFVRQRVTFERYVAFRFKTGQQVDQTEVERYYRRDYVPARIERGLAVEPLDSVEESIEAVLAEETANRLLEARLNELRLLHRVELTGLGTESGK